MPSSAAARKTRMAISLRLATIRRLIGIEAAASVVTWRSYEDWREKSARKRRPVHIGRGSPTTAGIKMRDEWARGDSRRLECKGKACLAPQAIPAPSLPRLGHLSLA